MSSSPHTADRRSGPPEPFGLTLFVGGSFRGGHRFSPLNPGRCAASRRRPAWMNCWYVAGRNMARVECLRAVRTRTATCLLVYEERPRVCTPTWLASSAGAPKHDATLGDSPYGSPASSSDESTTEQERVSPADAVRPAQFRAALGIDLRGAGFATREAVVSPWRWPGLGGVVGARGDLGAGLGQHLADRLDPVLGAVVVDVGDEQRSGHFRLRSSSAAAKNADAVRRISLARRRRPPGLRGSSASLLHACAGRRRAAQFRRIGPEPG